MITSLFFRCSALCILLISCLFAIGCETTAGTIALAALGATGAGGITPSSQIEQIYYLGSIEPDSQLPPTYYRITVRGQSSFISRMRYGSGWVPANVIDTLNTTLSFKDQELITTGQSGPLALDPLLLGRQMIQIGPENIRPVPNDHRLVVVMGASPEDFFNAIDVSLGTVAEVGARTEEQRLDQLLLRANGQLGAERELLTDVKLNIAAHANQETGN